MMRVQPTAVTHGGRICTMNEVVTEQRHFETLSREAYYRHGWVGTAHPQIPALIVFAPCKPR
jgi:hypothetical protein